MIEGKISSFGGPNDPGMDHSEGLALYEAKEADLRPDIFLPSGTDPSEGVSKRLRTTSYYIALRYDKSIPRKQLQNSAWKITNPKTGQSVVASLADWGPSEHTGRVVDASPAVLGSLRIETDDFVEVSQI